MLNQIILNGFLVKDSELKNAGEKGRILIFSIAHNQRNKSSTATFFIEINLFGSLAETLHPLLKKGKEVDVVGKFYISYWEYDGQRQSKPYIKASEIILRGRNEK